MSGTDSEFYDLVDVEEIHSENDFLYSRSRAVLAATLRDEDFLLVGLYRSATIDYIVVDLTDDAIPTRNEAGIRYCERIAIGIAEKGRRSVEALMLRKTFPVLLHLNETSPGSPLSLCLYAESPSSISRTWTAPKFLRRIKEWLELSSIGELHQTDQPVEHLFFESPFELVLPWNWDGISKVAVSAINFRTISDREHVTVRLAQLGEDESTELGILPYNIPTPAVVHGAIIRQPMTMRGLVDLLAGFEIDIVRILTKEIRSRVESVGVPITDDRAKTVLLLSIPVKRTESEEPERMAYMACLFNIGDLALGEKLGALISNDGRYFSSLGILEKQVADIDDIDMAPMEVLRENDLAAAQLQSGKSLPAINGAIVGVGSLGSAILEIFIRSGWGGWTIIDHDHVKPHNLSRHVLMSGDIGKAKVKAMHEHCEKITNSSIPIHGVIADALDVDNDEVQEVFRKSELIVDCSTTLEFPRSSSFRQEFGRHFSVFITPSGNGSVFFSEDVERSITLAAIEPQYYRAIINEDWGMVHLQSSGSGFHSGVGCRDISVVMPYSKVLTHASLLSEKIEESIEKTDAELVVWERDTLTKSIIQYPIPVTATQPISLEGYTLFLDSGLEQKLQSFRMLNLPNETGGVLLGYHDFNHGLIVVVDAMPAPSDSVSSGEEFERGIEGVKSFVEEAHRRTSGVVGYIGEWHSHPQGHSTQASDKDIVQLVYLGLGMSDDGLPAISLIVGDKEISPYVVVTGD